VPIPPHYKVIAFVVGAALLISMFAAIVGQYPASSPKPLVTPTEQTFSQAAQDGPGEAIAPDPTPDRAVPQIDAYAAPGGALLGQFDPASERWTFVGRHDGGWVQLARDSGPVWVRQAALRLDNDDLAAIAAAPDLTPRDVVPIAPAPMTGRGNGPDAPPVAPEQIIVVDQPHAPVAETGSKPADDRAAHHATAVARLQLPPPARDTMQKGSK
jgi:hypothetical protein